MCTSKTVLSLLCSPQRSPEVGPVPWQFLHVNRCPRMKWQPGKSLAATNGLSCQYRLKMAQHNMRSVFAGRSGIHKDPHPFNIGFCHTMVAHAGEYGTWLLSNIGQPSTIGFTRRLMTTYAQAKVHTDSRGSMIGESREPAWLIIQISIT